MHECLVDLTGGVAFKMKLDKDTNVANEALSGECGVMNHGGAGRCIIKGG